MSRQNLNNEGKPWKVLWFGDAVALSGFGRIGNEVCKRLARRGYDVQMAAVNYTGWPYDRNEYPFHIWPLGGQDLWNGITGIVNQTQPDVFISCQDFPYHQTLWQACRIDFSRLKWIWITPIDGTPVHPDWVKLCDFGDGRMVISRFGVEALRQAGKRVDLCHPGIDVNEFYPADADEKKALREKAGYTGDEYIIGVVCMNQGRKAIAPMIAAFHEFARDKPEARLILDMDKASPAGWDIPNLLKQMHWTEEEQKRVKYREDLFKAPDPVSADRAGGKQNDSMLPLRNRYALMDAHMVISHREGFGLPLLESMACHIPTIAMDWCSGTEIMGGTSGIRGILINRLPYMENGTWGGARDAFPDMDDLRNGLNMLYQLPTQAAAIAEKGYQWAVKQTWDVTTDQVEAVIQAALKRDRKERPSHVEPRESAVNPAPGFSDTYGPGYPVNSDGAGRPDSSASPNGAGGKTPDALGSNPGLQRPEAPDPLPEVAGADGGGGGPGRAVADPGAR